MDPFWTLCNTFGLNRKPIRTIYCICICIYVYVINYSNFFLSFGKKGHFIINVNIQFEVLWIWTNKLLYLYYKLVFLSGQQLKSIFYLINIHQFWLFTVHLSLYFTKKKKELQEKHDSFCNCMWKNNQYETLHV